MKLCPKCSAPADLNVNQCLRCGHQFRTIFQQAPTQIISPQNIVSPNRSAQYKKASLGCLAFLSIFFFLGWIVVTIGDAQRQSRRGMATDLNVRQISLDMPVLQVENAIGIEDSSILWPNGTNTYRDWSYIKSYKIPNNGEFWVSYNHGMVSGVVLFKDGNVIFKKGD